MPPKRTLSDSFAVHPGSRHDDDYSSWDQFDMIFQESMTSRATLNKLSEYERSYGMLRYNRAWGNPKATVVPGSHPLANMVAEVQELIDPDFDPFQPAADETPLFLRPLPSRILPDDIEYLKLKGALEIPGVELRNELLRSYVQWVHSFMPLLDLHEFLRGIAENDPDANISLLLFQAVMFAGTAFVDLKYLQEAGFATRRDARRAFFSRVKLLYSFDYEEDRIAILQAILLMTYWYEVNCSPQKDIWHWVGVCNTQAQSIGLHRDPTKSNMDIKTQRLRIRLWWSLYSRDRLIALALRRPMQISEGSCDVPMIKVDDFDIRPFHPKIAEMLHCRQLENTADQRHLAEMFVEKAKLCQCLGRVLFARYSPSNHDFGATHKTTITLLPRQASEAELDRCSQKLDTWANGLSKLVKSYPEQPSRLSQGEDVLYVHSAMLKMVYHATASALHRPYSAPKSDHPYSSHSDKWKQTSLQKIHYAATGTAEIAKGLSQMDLTKFLPPSGVTVLLPAAIAHMTNFASPNNTLRDESKWNFHKCLAALNNLRDIYPAADLETANIEAALKLKFTSSLNSIMIWQSPKLDFGGRGPHQPTNTFAGTRRSPLSNDKAQITARRPNLSRISPVETDETNFQGNVVELDDNENNQRPDTASRSRANSVPNPNQSTALCITKEIRDEDFYSFAAPSKRPRLQSSPNLDSFVRPSTTPSFAEDTTTLQTMLGLTNDDENEAPWSMGLADGIDEQEQQLEERNGHSSDNGNLLYGRLGSSTPRAINTETREMAITGDLETDLGLN